MPQENYDTRRRSYYGHQGANMQARRMMEEAGAPQDQLPMNDAREVEMQNYLAESAGPQVRRDMASQRANTADLDRQARAAGFRNYEEMRVYMMQRENKVGGSVPESGASRDSGSGGTNAMSWHPAQLLGYVQRKWDEATGN